jgi:hypothetical protein
MTTEAASRAPASRNRAWGIPRIDYILTWAVVCGSGRIRDAWEAS